jgi:hypothetical protein
MKEDIKLHVLSVGWIIERISGIVSPGGGEFSHRCWRDLQGNHEIPKSKFAGKSTLGSHGSSHRLGMDMGVSAYEIRCQYIHSIKTLDHFIHV